MRAVMGFRGLISALVLLGAVAPAAAQTGALTVPVRAEDSPTALVVEDLKLYGSSHALVIGIDNYTGGWPRLSNAVGDARLIGSELARHGFDVTLKTDLSSVDLKDTLETFFIDKGADPEARLFVWFAGHGHSEAGEGFLIPADAPVADAGPRFRRSALSLRRFGEFVRQARSKHAYAVFDSCFSGTVFDMQRALPPRAITAATRLPVRQFLSSGDAGQTVFDNGTFRELFIRALRGEETADANRDGYVTASEIGLYLSDRVANLTRMRQTPRYGKLNDKDLDRGEFVFKAIAAAATAAAPVATPGQLSMVETRAPASAADDETLFWQSIMSSTNPADYRAYLETYPNGRFAALARVRAAAAPPPAPQAVLAPAEQERERAAIEQRRRERETLFRTIEELSRSAPQQEAPAAPGTQAAVTPPASPLAQPPVQPAVGLHPAAPRPGDTFKDCDLCPEMVVVPAGGFTMGSPASEAGRAPDEGPQRRVTIGRPFAVGKYEVTFAEWDACLADGGCGGHAAGDGGWGRGRRPAIDVSWEDARRYVDWLSRRSGKAYRLLSEAEWEYAARAGTATARHWGDGIGREQANCSGCSSRGDNQRTVPVGGFAANPFGLHDMLGNVWEWVEDCWNDGYAGAPADGSAWTGGTCARRVLRGGSWRSVPGALRSADRGSLAADFRSTTSGFRVARSL